MLSLNTIDLSKLTLSSGNKFVDRQTDKQTDSVITTYYFPSEGHNDGLML